jgi:sterol desaturase/sphingolipid hydroxylase (fatty acid hydroxylase superfamily)
LGEGRAGTARVRGYEKRDTFASLGMGVGNVIISAFTTGSAFALWTWGYQHRVLQLGQAQLWWSWVALFFAEDLCYYWFHRSHHEVRLLWAAHVSHHTSQYFNLSTALRQPWFTPISGPIFWLPLALVGFPPAMILCKNCRRRSNGCSIRRRTTACTMAKISATWIVTMVAC